MTSTTRSSWCSYSSSKTWKWIMTQGRSNCQLTREASLCRKMHSAQSAIMVTMRTKIWSCSVVCAISQCTRGAMELMWCQRMIGSATTAAAWHSNAAYKSDAFSAPNVEEPWSLQVCLVLMSITRGTTSLPLRKRDSTLMSSCRFRSRSLNRIAVNFLKRNFLKEKIKTMLFPKS
mgnify:CR=1 FL=1